MYWYFGMRRTLEYARDVNTCVSPIRARMNPHTVMLTSMDVRMSDTLAVTMNIRNMSMKMEA